MHIIYRFVKSSYNIHQCLRCILGHSQWSESLHITSANPRLAVIELHTKLQLFSLSVSRVMWSWLKHFWPRLNRFNPNWANPPICFRHIYKLFIFIQRSKPLKNMNTFWVEIVYIFIIILIIIITWTYTQAIIKDDFLKHGEIEQRLFLLSFRINYYVPWDVCT